MHSPLRPTLRLDEAIARAPALSSLVHQARASEDLLAALRPLLPAGLRQSVMAGPLEGRDWCLLARNPAAATKLRQCVPDLLEALRRRGKAVEAIQVRVAAPQRPT